MIDRRVVIKRAGRLAGAATGRLWNQIQAPRFRMHARRSGIIPNGAVALYFATGPENFYQFELWRRPLERLADLAAKAAAAA